jgi:hypothetical protein
MKKNMNVFALLTTILLTLNISSANADATYAMLDANGNVTNIIVCGSACSGGEFAGQKVVLQVAADPVTGENRGGLWHGPGTTTYDSNSQIFTMTDPTARTYSVPEIENTQIVTPSPTENTETVTSSVTINNGITTQFKYSDTIGDNLSTRSGFTYGYLENTSATISVITDDVTESVGFNSRKTENEIKEFVENSELVLLNSKIKILIALLGTWVK